MSMHLAQINIARLLYPQGDPRVAGFFDNLDRLNAVAETVVMFKVGSRIALNGESTIKSRMIVNCKMARMAITNFSYPENGRLAGAVVIMGLF
jgi:hypothetical protein